MITIRCPNLIRYRNTKDPTFKKIFHHPINTIPKWNTSKYTSW